MLRDAEEEGASRSLSINGGGIQNEEIDLLVSKDMKDIDMKTKSTSGIAMSSFNLSNAVLGGGILSFPYAFAEAGLLGGILATLFLLTFAYGALIAIVATIDIYAKKGANSYQSLVKVVYGNAAEMVLIVSIAIYGFGGCITFLVIIGDQLTPVVEYFVSGSADSVLTRPLVIFVSGLVFVLPLCCLKQISKLGYSSFLAIVMVYYFTLMLVIYSLVGTEDYNDVPTPSLISETSTIFDDIVWFNVSPEFFQCAPIICFAFQCHLSSVPIYNELKDKTPKRMATVCFFALGNCLLLYSLAGVAGYVTFFCTTQSDVLLNYNISNVPVIICRMGMGLVAGFSYPMLNFVSRLACNDLYLRIMDAMDYGPIKKKNVDESNVRFYSITILFFTGTLLIAMLVPTVNAVISLIGSIFATLFIFIFPGGFLITLAKHHQERETLLDFLGALFLVVGFSVGGISLVVSLINDVITVTNGAPTNAC